MSHLRVVPPPDPSDLILRVWYFAPDLTGASQRSLSAASSNSTFKLGRTLYSSEGRERFRIFSLRGGSAGPRLDAARIFSAGLRTFAPVQAAQDDLSLRLNQGVPAAATLLLRNYKRDKITHFLVVTELQLMADYFGPNVKAGKFSAAAIVYPPSPGHPRLEFPPGG